MFFPFQWFLEKLGHEGLNNLLAAYIDKTAYAQCIVAYCEGPGHEIKVRVNQIKSDQIRREEKRKRESSRMPVP